MTEGASKEGKLSVEAFANNTITQLAEVYLQLSEQNKQITKAAREHIRQDKPFTVLPASAANPAYEKVDSNDKVQFLKERLTGRVLDIGSGGNLELRGVSPDNRTIYVDQEPSEGTIQADAHHLPFESGSFDSIYSRNCMQTDPDGLIPEALRVLRPAGKMVVETSLATFEGAEKGLLSILSALDRNGVKLDSQCELVLNQNVLRHKTLELQSIHPVTFITISKSS